MLECVKKFVYLGILFQENSNIDGEIDRRVSAESKVVGSMTGLDRSESSLLLIFSFFSH
jgi:hypothetical protein